jgi:16S rRNA C1402 (ribose-2'-O) methylase RsmI
VCRELTKLHESLVRGPISAVLDSLGEVRGEITVVIDLVDKPNAMRSVAPGGGLLALELAHITNAAGISRRKAINILAKRYSLHPNEVYDAIEKAKQLAE